MKTILTVSFSRGLHIHLELKDFIQALRFLVVRLILGLTLVHQWCCQYLKFLFFKLFNYLIPCINKSFVKLVASFYDCLNFQTIYLLICEKWLKIVAFKNVLIKILKGLSLNFVVLYRLVQELILTIF